MQTIPTKWLVAEDYMGQDVVIHLKYVKHIQDTENHTRVTFHNGSSIRLAGTVEELVGPDGENLATQYMMRLESSKLEDVVETMYEMWAEGDLDGVQDLYPALFETWKTCVGEEKAEEVFRRGKERGQSK